MVSCLLPDGSIVAQLSFDVFHSCLVYICSIVIYRWEFMVDYNFFKSRCSICSQLILNFLLAIIIVVIH